MPDITIGAQTSTTHANYAQEKFPDAELKIYPSPDEYKLDLANGRLDAAIDDVVVLDEWMKSEAGACCKILGVLPTDPVINGDGAGIAHPQGGHRPEGDVQQGDRGDPRRRHLQGDQRQVFRVRRLRQLIRGPATSNRRRGLAPAAFRQVPVPSPGDEDRDRPMPDLLALLAFGPTGWGDEILAGAWLTIRLALATLPVGLALGFLVALAKRSQLDAAARLRRGFLHDLPRPAGAADALHRLFRRPDAAAGGRAASFTDAPVEANGFIAGMLALGVVFAAYASEVFTAAFNGIPIGQWEGGRGDRPAPLADDAARHPAAAPPPRAARPRQSLAGAPEGHLARLGHRARTTCCA